MRTSSSVLKVNFSRGSTRGLISTSTPINCSKLVVNEIIARRKILLNEVTDFISVNESLEIAVKKIDSSLIEFLDALSRIKTKRLRRKALRLTRIMDGYLKNNTPRS